MADIYVVDKNYTTTSIIIDITKFRYDFESSKLSFATTNFSLSISIKFVI